MPPRAATLKIRALRWLAQREHSRIELRRKLLRLLARGTLRGADSAEPAEPGDPALEVDALLEWLEARGYLSQQRFVESRVLARQARFGNLRIQQELQHHGVKLDPEAKQTLRETELRRAHEVLRKKYDAPAPDAAGRLKQLRFLAGRGFSMDVVRRVVLAARHGGDNNSASDDDSGGNIASNDDNDNDSDAEPDLTAL